MPSLRPLQMTGYSSNRIDMVFLGDGYTSSEIATTYTAQIQGLLGTMFNGGLLSDPFGRYRNFFNIHSIDIESNESGADDLSKGISRDTALDASYSGRALNISLDKADAIEEEVLRYAGFASEMRFILVNSESYGGAGYDSGIYSAGHSQAHEIALHEIGHAFAGLGDEYDYGASGSYSGSDPAYANVTNDPSGVKWSEWLGYDQPGIGVIGAYEGAYYHATGAYRPSVDSKMKTLGRPFDAIAREQFVLKFYEFVDPLDGYTDLWSAHHNRSNFYVDTIDPAVIKVDWTLDGRAFVDAGETFSLAQDNCGFGTHTLRARAYDPTDWVRGNRSSLEQTVTWTVTNDFLLTGDGASNNLRGNAQTNEVQGRGGNDKLWGGAGNDVLIGGAGETPSYSTSGRTRSRTGTRSPTTMPPRIRFGSITRSSRSWGQGRFRSRRNSPPTCSLPPRRLRTGRTGSFTTRRRVCCSTTPMDLGQRSSRSRSHRSTKALR
ncbi:hypothetical protein ILT44_04595 [Microvirga sp. BT689]|uniref:M64 family metallopeptidase n=1 Tax=Microvirga arvi TaxID=2778731 RepID=UPI0019511BF2|nr:M64 family metallopeptidase [Microvirga arvi]MBM6579453.1 hypothetical protein [Microvirga arvi]